jgi:hypothetical protein
MQVVLDAFVFSGARANIAYLFISNDLDDSLPTMLPESGENAVILYPGKPEGPTARLQTGPTLEEHPGSPLEFSVELSQAEDPDPVADTVFDSWDKATRNAYCSSITGCKIGGTPAWVGSPNFPPGGPWRLLLQLEPDKPTSIVPGDAGVVLAFINHDGTKGRMLWESQ